MVAYFPAEAHNIAQSAFDSVLLVLNKLMDVAEEVDLRMTEGNLRAVQAWRQLKYLHPLYTTLLGSP